MFSADETADAEIDLDTLVVEAIGSEAKSRLTNSETSCRGKISLTSREGDFA